MDVRGENILILGLAREGVSLARFLAEAGANVTVTDSASAARLAPRLAGLAGPPVRTVLGADYPALVAGMDRFFVSPGVPESNAVYRAAGEAGMPIESMTTLFFDLCRAPIVGITGSSGKTTTTGLIGHILSEDTRDVVVGGNIGDPMLDLLPAIGPATTVVLELSSFQLSILRRSPHLAVVTNISPNHLDRHGTMEAYVDAKLNIVRYQSAGDLAVLNAGDSASATFARATIGQIRWFGPGAHDGAAVQGDWIGTIHSGEFEPVLPCDDVPLLGRHNLENVLAAVAATDLLGVAPAAMAHGIATFRPAAHRLQTVAERDGVRYIDDSIATSPARAVVALEALREPILLIAGGRDKNLPWEEFAAVAAARVRTLFLIGEAAESIEAAVRGAISPESRLQPEHIYRCPSLEAAVADAGRMARPGEVVLLSPGCASYDMFDDFEERGRVFARAVEELCAA